MLNKGFNLIDISSVLFVIGVVLTGRDLISTAAANAQISQNPEVQVVPYADSSIRALLPTF